MNITIIGAGNGGQAMAAHFTLLGHKVCLFNRQLDSMGDVKSSKKIELKGRIDSVSYIDKVTDNYQEALMDAEIVMIVTVANAHKQIALEIAPFTTEGQIFILNPGRSFGALQFRKTYESISSKRIYVAETQSLIYACRIMSSGVVNVIGIKNKVPLSALPSSDTDYVINKINTVFNCFIKADNVLHTSLSNIGAILHPAIVLFNVSNIERKNRFYFYKDMTIEVSNFIIKLDKERLSIGKAYGLNLLSISDWISFSYEGITGDSFLDKIRNNPAYSEIYGPTHLTSRLLTEDIPTGIIPMISLAKKASIKTPLMIAILNMSMALLGINFDEDERSLVNLGLDDLNKDEFIRTL
jgi:opine dehydrogenase